MYSIIQGQFNLHALSYFILMRIVLCYSLWGIFSISICVTKYKSELTYCIRIRDIVWFPVMVTISSGLCFLPILWSFLLVVTVIVSRLMANNTEFDDSVHSASAFQWSHSIFSQLLDLLALVGLLSIFIRYLHLEVVTRGLPQETNASIGRIRLASLIFGMGTMTGITVISNFRQPGEKVRSISVSII